MAKWKEVLLLFINVLLCFEAQSGYLDFDELSSVNYGIDIIDRPVVIGQESPGAILMRSKYGQRYQCSYLDRETEDERERLEQQEAIETGIPELLRPMASAACLVYPKDWWTYELCYGKHVKQYHIEDNKITGNIIYLGFYESEFDWSNITEKDKKRKYHSHTYTNGTTCDLTDKPRQVQVRFECEEGEADVISEISEAQTCVYTLTVHTPRLCKHPYLKKAAPAKPVPITCNPLISAEQFEAYLNTERERIHREEGEELMKNYRLVFTEGGETGYTKKYKLIDSTVSSNENDAKDGYAEDQEQESIYNKAGHGQNDDIESRSSDVDDSSLEEPQEKSDGTSRDAGQTRKMNMDFFTKELLNVVMGVKTEPKEKEDRGQTEEALVKQDQDKGLDQSQGQDTGLGQGQNIDQGQDTGFDRSQGQGANLDHDQNQVTGLDLEQGEDTSVKKQVHIEEVGTGQVEDAELSLDRDESGEALEERPADHTGFTTQQDDVDDDEKIMAEFDKELNEIVNTAEKKARLALHEDTLESAMNAKFSDIVNEAEEELAQEGNPVKADKGQAFNQLAKTLTKLLSRLQRTAREKRIVEKHLQDAQLLAAAAKIRQASKEKRDTIKKVPDSVLQEKANVEPQEKTPTEENILEKEHSVKEPSKEDAAEDSDVTDDGSSLTQLHSLNNRVRVRVTRIKHASSGEGEGVDKKVDDGDATKQTLQIPDDQREELESTVKTELEKAGLETKGQKIEVKIITAGYFDTNKEGVHVLSEEESSAFNNMIISILGGNSQAAKEMTHQQQMEDAYNHVWGNNKKQKSTSQAPPTPAPPS